MADATLQFLYEFTIHPGTPGDSYTERHLDASDAPWALENVAAKLNLAGTPTLLHRQRTPDGGADGALRFDGNPQDPSVQFTITPVLSIAGRHFRMVEVRV